MIVTLSWLGSFQTTARGVSPSETTTGSSCAAFAAAEMGKVNRDIAIIGARTSDFFAQESSKFTNVTYNSVFETVHWSGPPTCIPSNELLNIVFAAYNFSRFTGYMVISEDPSTLTPNSVRLQTQSLRFDSCPTGSCFWAGHEVNAAGCIYDPCYGTGPYTIYGATAEFYVSPISYPPTGCRDSYTCAMSSWVGLENSIGAGDRNLAQAGVLGTCQGSFPFGGPCTPYYTAWY